MSTFSLEQSNKTGNFDAHLILLQYKQELMSRFMDLKTINPKLTRKEPKK